MQNQLILIALIALQVVIIILLIRLNSKTKKNNKKTEEIIRQYKDRLREDELDNALMNQCYKVDKEKTDWVNVPYEVKYTDEDNVRSTNAICVHFECDGRLANKKYLINVRDEIYLGKNKTNGIVLDEDDIAPKHIHFTRQGRELYAKNLSEDKMVHLRRGKTKYSLLSDMVKINDGDVLEFVESKVIINLI